jgi:hypothetical protein
MLLLLNYRGQAIPWNIDLFNRTQRRTYYIFTSERTEIYVTWKVFPKSFKKNLIIFGSVEFFGAEKFQLLIFPCLFQKLDLKERFELGWNVL